MNLFALLLENLCKATEPVFVPTVVLFFYCSAHQVLVYTETVAVPVFCVYIMNNC